MSNSSLVTYTKISPNKTSPRNHAIDTITIHCMAGNLTVESCGNIFSDKTKKASSNYGIGTDGRIALYVEEKDRSWCSSSATNDNRAITIEVANDGGSESGWHVSDKAIQSLIKLCADICKRNKIGSLKWKADKSLIGKIDQQNMTVHRWFAQKSCPGDYLFSKHTYIAQEVNKLLSADEMDYSPVFDMNYYANRYRDLGIAKLDTYDELLNHFLKCGIYENRQACPTFNIKVYKDNNKDLRDTYKSDMLSYIHHYIRFGQFESGRIKV